MRNTRDSLGGSAIGSHESDQGDERDPGNILGPSQSGHIDSPLTMSGTLGELRTKTKVAFMILGASVLLPWNAMITATPFFLSRLKGSSFHSVFNSYLTLSLTAANFACLAHATVTSKPSDSTSRIRKSTTILAVLFSLLAISPFFTVSSSTFFAFVILNGVIQSGSASYLQTSIMSLASLFGPSAIQIAYSGQAIVGVAVSVVQYTSAAAEYKAGGSTIQTKGEKDTANLGSFLFFGLGALFLGCSLIAHTALTYTSAYKAATTPYTEPDDEPVIDEDDLDQVEDQPFLGVAGSQIPGKHSILQVAKVNWMYNVAVAYIFVVTLAVFPPITSSILSVNLRTSSPIFDPTLFISLHFLLFNLSDWLGRYLTSYPRFLIWSPRNLLLLSVLRTIFIPLFLLCNIPSSQPQPQFSSSPFFNSDLIYFMILIAFGVSNGHISSLCMMAAPSLQHNERLKKEQVATAATVAQFCLVGGLVIGSAFSFGVRAMICDCDPFRG